jgi:chemotaxis protein histidine kinase CheA
MAFVFDSKLDQTFMESLYGDDIQYAQEVFEGFLAHTKNEFEELKSDYQQNAMKNIRQKLHKIKPTFGFVGLTALTEKTETVIAAFDASLNTSATKPDCTELFKEMEDSFLLVENELKRMKVYTA